MAKLSTIFRSSIKTDFQAVGRTWLRVAVPVDIIQQPSTKWVDLFFFAVIGLISNLGDFSIQVQILSGKPSKGRVPEKKNIFVRAKNTSVLFKKSCTLPLRKFISAKKGLRK